MSKLMTSIFAVGSLVFGKIHGYAEAEKRDLENLRMLLETMQNGQIENEDPIA
jgi:hypothetical protein